MTEAELLLRIKTEADLAGLDSVASKAGGMTDKLGGMSKAMGVGLLAGGAAAVGFGVAAVAAASDVAESQNKVNVVFGESAGAINDLADTAAAKLGQTKGEVLNAAGGIGNLLTAMGQSKEKAAEMSVSMVTLASDLGSFNNASSTEVLEAMQAAMAGETDGMKKYGVAITEATLKQAAMDSGLGDNVQALSAAEKQMLTMKIMMEQTTSAQGDFANTSGGMANGMKIIKASMTDAVASIGAGLLPAVEKAGQGISTFLQSEKFEEFKNKLIDMFAVVGEKLAAIDWGKVTDTVISIGEKVGAVFTFLAENPMIAKIALVIGGLVAAFAPLMVILGPIIPVVMSVGAAIGTAVTAAGGFTAVLGTVAAVLTGPVTIAIALVIGAFVLWQAKGDEIKAWLAEAAAWIGAKFTEIKDWVVGVLGELGAQINAYWDAYIAYITAVLTSIAAYVSEKWQAIKDYLFSKLAEIGADISAAWTAIKDVITERIEAARVLISAKWDAIKEYLSATVAGILADVTTKWTELKDKVSQTITDLKEALAAKWLAIKAEIVQTVFDLVSDAYQKFMEIKAKFDSVVSDLKDALAMKWLAIKAEIITHVTNWIVAAHDKFVEIKERLSSVVADLKEAIGMKLLVVKAEIVAKIQDWIGAAAQKVADFKKVGEDLINGMVDGVKAAWDIFYKWASDTFGGLAAKIREWLGGGHSPIPTFIPVGRDIVLGLLVGVQAAFKANSLEKSVKEWASQLRPSAVAALISPRIGAGLAAAIAIVALGGSGSGLPGQVIGGGGSGLPGQVIGGSGTGRAGGQAWGANAIGGSRVGIQQKKADSGETGVRADAFRSGVGGHLAASSSNYWRVFVSKWGVPTESSARKVARQLGIPLPAWLEDIYNPPGGSTVDRPDPLKDPEAAAGVGDALLNMAKAAEDAAAAINTAAAVILQASDLANRRPGSDPGLRPLPGGGNVGGPIVIEPPPGSDVKVSTVEIGAVNTNATFMLDGKVLARAIIDTMAGDTVALDKLGKALGKRKAVTS